MQAQNIKTDRNDARAIAQVMRTGWFKAAHVKGEQSQKIRAIMSSRRCLLDKQLDLDNHIRATLRTFGLKVGAVSLTAFEAVCWSWSRRAFPGDVCAQTSRIIPFTSYLKPKHGGENHGER